MKPTTIPLRISFLRPWRWRHRIRPFLACEDASVAIEYTVMAAGISVFLTGAYLFLGGKLQALFAFVAQYVGPYI